MEWNYDMEACPLDTKVYLLSGDESLLLPQREYVGTITHNGRFKTRGKCFQGDPDLFYRSAIVAWKEYNDTDEPDVQQTFREQGKTADGVLLYISDEDEFLSIEYGDGCNITKEDISNGYDSYLNIRRCRFEDGEFEEVDGGIIMYHSDECDYDQNICNTVENVILETYEKKLNYIFLKFL